VGEGGEGGKEKRGNGKEKRGQGKSITFNLSGISDNARGS
jgi:hypothetical protein